MFSNLRADLRHYSKYCYSGKPIWRVLPRILYAHPASVAVIWYRFGRLAYKLRFPLLREFLKLIYLSLLPFVRVYSGVQLLPATEVGPGLAILHFGGVVITPRTTIGKNCLLHHNVSIVAMRANRGATIGNSFYAGVGVTVVDNITIEDNVTAGAACVITKSVPRDAIVAGVPARIIRFREAEENAADNLTLPEKPASWLRFPEPPPLTRGDAYPVIMSSDS